MSHIMKIAVQLLDKAALERACDTCKLQLKGAGTHTIYTNTVTGIAIELPGWLYPVVVQDDGTLQYDNFGGRWGKMRELDKLVQAYSVEVTLKEAANSGYMCTQEELTNGEIRLTLCKLEDY